MPKLGAEVIEEKKQRIEDAAKDLFIKQGFHATSMRDIAAKAGVSLGNLYNYFKTKESILESIIAKYLVLIDERLKNIFQEIEEPLLPENLLLFGKRIKSVVDVHHDFWLLMYIDVLEFQNQHFRKMFDGLAKNLQRQFNRHFSALKKHRALHKGIDPAVGFTAIYMQFFNYFLVEKLFGGNRHFGMSDEKVISTLTEIFSRGMLEPDGISRLRAKPARAKPRPARKLSKLSN
ncbi:MAG: TetR/AcrR family transcriptional regulator [Acidobacteriota bacterium]